MGSHEYDFDLVVLGGGPGGVATATSAALRGYKVAVVSANWLMGYGLEGAYKSKSMYELARHLHKARLYWGKAAAELSRDPIKVYQNTSAGAARLRNVHRHQLEKMGISLFEGFGRFEDPHTILVESQDSGETRTITGDKITIATGTRPRCLPGMDADHKHILTSDEVVNIHHSVESMLILGAGVIGCEFASIFAAMGTKVTLIDSQPSILPHDDPDISKLLAGSLRAMGVEIINNERSQGMEVMDGRVHTTLRSGRVVETESALLAIGRIPNTGDLNLEKAGVEMNKWGYIPVSDHMQSNVEHIYAVGDVGLRDCDTDLCLVHVAEAEGRAASAHMLQRDSSISPHNVPFIIFTLPMIAGAGLNEKEALEKYGAEVRVGKYAHVRNSRAHAMQSTEGFVKLIVGPPGDDRVLGARGIGEGVDVIVGQVAVMIEHGLPYTHLLNSIHAHPCLSESLKGAALMISGDLPPYISGEEKASFTPTGTWRTMGR